MYAWEEELFDKYNGEYDDPYWEKEVYLDHSEDY